MLAQVNFYQFPAEIAGNHYLRTFSPAQAVNFTRRRVYLQPSQVILHALVVQCTWSETFLKLRALPEITRSSCNSCCIPDSQCSYSERVFPYTA